MHISNEELSKYIITLVNFDFSPAQIKRIIVRSMGIKDKVAEIDTIYPKFCKNMLSRGYTEEQIRQVVCYYPPAMFYKFYHKELSQKFISCINEALSQDITIKASPNALSYDFDGVYEILTDLGVSEKRIEYIFRTGPEIIFISSIGLKQSL